MAEETNDICQKVCNVCKESKHIDMFKSNRKGPVRVTNNCSSCREKVNIRSKQYRNTKDTSRTRNTNTFTETGRRLNHPRPLTCQPTKTTTNDIPCGDTSDTELLSLKPIKRPRPPLCNQDFGTLLEEQSCMCAGPNKSINSKDYCLNNEVDRRIMVLNNKDHIQKHAFGGSNNLINLQLLCLNCHGLKCLLERKEETDQYMNQEEINTLTFFKKPKYNSP